MANSSNSWNRQEKVNTFISIITLIVAIVTFYVAYVTYEVNKRSNTLSELALKNDTADKRQDTTISELILANALTRQELQTLKDLVLGTYGILQNSKLSLDVTSKGYQSEKNADKLKTLRLIDTIVKRTNMLYSASTVDDFKTVADTFYHLLSFVADQTTSHNIYLYEKPVIGLYLKDVDSCLYLYARLFESKLGTPEGYLPILRSFGLMTYALKQPIIESPNYYIEWKKNLLLIGDKKFNSHF